ncbi:hypothetical protein NRIC_11160 [Enterococcus florum]|uniref:Uncharacterized protein n=1 Tax=Enterococcus florum TaxID=2480627 RepID=A0A4P5P5T9_9ENTE|nr:hypothetical protein [Enterococcus florum]GCF93225.1 hypothetical protein NRIC_11160 [Enterococcus florum]
MKKMILLVGTIIAFGSPIVGQAATSPGANTQDIQTIQENGIFPRSVYTYFFSSVPPKKFNGMTRLYYEYRSKEKVYIGYYQ